MPKLRNSVGLARVLMSVGVLAAAAMPGEAMAQGFDPAFKVRVGGIFAGIDTDIEVDPEAGSGSGTDIDLESDLDFDNSSKLLFAEGSYRFASRWKVGVQYLSLSRGRSVTLDQDITVGETTYPVAAAIRSKFGSKVYMAHVSWSAIKTDKVDAGLSLGAHITDFKFEISGFGSVDGVLAGGRDEARSVTAPLPNIGAFANVEVLPRVKVTGQVKYLDLKVDDLKGGITDLEANIAYQFTKNFAVGAGYRQLGYRLDADKEKFRGSARYKFGGPVLFLEARF